MDLRVVSVGIKSPPKDIAKMMVDIRSAQKISDGGADGGELGNEKVFMMFLQRYTDRTSRNSTFK
jgi:hypothetical protein